MNDPDGRYANSARLQITGADGRVVTYLARRFLPDPESLPVAGRARIEPGDRLDLFAARTMGSAPHWWRIADAHRVIHAEVLEEPVGRLLTVPLPEAGQ